MKNKKLNTEKFDQFYKPTQHISYNAMGKHQITEEMVKDKEVLGKNSAPLAYFASKDPLKTILVAHNISYHLNLLENIGFVPTCRKIDTYQCALHLLPDAEGHSLYTLFYELGLHAKFAMSAKLFGLDIEKPTPHNALHDAVVLTMVYKHLLSMVGGEIKELIRLSSEPALLRTIKFGKYSGQEFWENSLTDPEYLSWLRESRSDMDINLIHTINYYLPRGEAAS